MTKGKDAQVTRFLILFLLSVVIAWRPLLSTFQLAIERDPYTQILLVLPITTVLIYSDWRASQIDKRSGVPAGSVILGFALGLASVPYLAANWMSTDLSLSINMLAVVFWWIGTFVLLFGTQASRAAVFPLCFLLWIVPLPSFVLNEFVRWLQQGSALAARMLFSLAGVPVAQDGLMLSIPGLTVEVATECSSIRSSLMLLVTSMVLAQLLLRTPWRKLLVIATAVPFSVAKNGLRIFTIAMLGTKVDPQFLTGKLHHQGGIVFFAIALAFIFGLIWMLRRSETRSIASRKLSPVIS